MNVQFLLNLKNTSVLLTTQPSSFENNLIFVSVSVIPILMIMIIFLIFPLSSIALRKIKRKPAYSFEEAYSVSKSNSIIISVVLIIMSIMGLGSDPTFWNLIFNQIVSVIIAGILSYFLNRRILAGKSRKSIKTNKDI